MQNISVVRYIGIKRHHQLCDFHKTIGATILSESAPIVRALGIIFVLRSVNPVGLELQWEGLGQGGRTWQPFAGSKNFRQTRI